MNTLLQDLLVHPQRAPDLSPAEWDLLIPQAKNAFLLATVGQLLEQHDLLARIPERPRSHLLSEVIRHQRQCAALNYETRWLLRALRGMDVPLVLLKGGAYIQAGLPASSGRMISDIDLMVPNHRIDEVEKAFNQAGWQGGFADEYDERYYREWMHEIPPLSHPDRGSTLDLHHTIVPPTASPHTDASKLFESLRELRPGLYTLSPVDMVIHSATHLFHEGEFHHGFRDVLDLDRLLRGFAESEPDFWERLLPRASELSLLKSVFYGLRYAHQMLGTPVPAEVLAASWQGIGGKALVPVMDFLFIRALAPDHFSCQRRYSKLAKFLLYVRSHYIRMPLRLLVPHLFRKAVKRRFFKKSDAQEAADES